MSYTTALQSAITLYGENWFRECTVRLTSTGAELVYAVFCNRPSLRAFRRSTR